MPDPYTDFYAAFLKDHPEELAGFKTVTIEGERQVTMNTATARRFIQWSLGMGLVTHHEAALAMLEELPPLEARAKAWSQERKETPRHGS